MRHLSKLLTVIVAFVILVISSPRAFAEESSTEELSNNNSLLQISPVTKRLILNPNETSKHTIEVKNIGDKEIKVDVYVTPYSTISGTANLDFKSETNYTQISRWITFLDDNGEYHSRISFDLPVESARTINYRISVPESVAAGGQYAGIFAEAVPDATEGITTTTRVGMLLYANVKGETHSSSKVSNIKSSFVSVNRTVSVSADVENSGNIDYQATMEITVSTLFGKELYNNTVVSSILPESLKKVIAEWDSGSGYGLYRVHYAVKALDITIEGSRIVLVLPPATLVFGIFLLIAFIIAITYLVKRKKSAPIVETE